MDFNAEAKIAVIIPSYNAEKYIASTLRSVIDQTFTNWKAIVVDDCSTDCTCEIVNNFAKNDKRIHLIALEKNNGAPAAPRNIGVREAKAEWIAFLDADDIWHPKKLEYQVFVIEKYKIDFCSTGMKNFENEGEINFDEPSEIKVSSVTFSQQLKKMRTPTSSVVIRRSLMLSHPFNEDIRYKAREDFECWLRIHEHIGRSIKIDFFLLNYRIIQGQISGSKLKMLEKTFMVLDEYRLKNGMSLRISKYYYFFTYVFYSVYYRVIKKTL